MAFLPICRQDLETRGWEELDFIFVSGDAYVDHPSFGPALLCRLLESNNYRVGIISQPDWKNPESFRILGRPRLAFLVSGGNMDSMVMHYTASKKPRSQDMYTPGKEAGKRPDRATIVYSAAIRQAWKNAVIIIGGIEASLRRLAHYDYWSNKVRRSILLDAKADLGVYGMGESALLQIAERLKNGIAIRDIHDVRGTFFRCSDPHTVSSDYGEPILLPDFETVQTDTCAYAESFKLQYLNTDPFSARPLAEKSGNDWVYQTPPALVLDQASMDQIYGLNYERRAHPSYDEAGGIAALEEVRFSLVSVRGCFGACSFCALSFHQGRLIQTRSHESIIKEAQIISKLSDFKGYIHDLGGPSANFRHNPCQKSENEGACLTRRCLVPQPCKKLYVDHQDYLSLLRKLRALPGIKKVFIRSGIRFDYLCADPNKKVLEELVEHHISGQLKVAPEHVSPSVLALMGKPSKHVYDLFRERYLACNQSLDKKQFLVPYFISGHPGAQLSDAIELACYLRKTGFVPEQVQDFYPTPGTLSTAMYYTGIDPLSGKEVYVCRDSKEKAWQRALLQFNKAENWKTVREALLHEGRDDLIGTQAGCLIPSYPGQRMKKV